MKIQSVKPKSNDSSPAITKTKTASKVFASTSKADAPTVGHSAPRTNSVKCTACKEKHTPVALPCVSWEDTNRESEICSRQQTLLFVTKWAAPKFWK